VNKTAAIPAQFLLHAYARITAAPSFASTNKNLSSKLI